jgi:hypothetical protein
MCPNCIEAICTNRCDTHQGEEIPMLNIELHEIPGAVGDEEPIRPQNEAPAHRAGGACDCTAMCGDDPWIRDGRATPCANYVKAKHRSERPRRIEAWKSTSADDLKSTLRCLVDRNPADAAEDCLYALRHGEVTGKTHRKHIAAALRTAATRLEVQSHD